MRCPRLARGYNCYLGLQLGRSWGAFALWHGVHDQLSASSFYLLHCLAIFVCRRILCFSLEQLVTFSSVLCPLPRRQQGFAVGWDAFRVRTRRMLKLLLPS